MLFLSYPRKSAPLAHAIRLEMQRRGYAVFLDTAELGPGRWEEQLRTAIKEASDFLVLINSEAAESAAVADEATYALSLDKAIVPIFQDGYAPPTDAKQWLVRILTYQAARLDVLDPVVSCDRIVALVRGKPPIQHRLGWKVASSVLAVALITGFASILWPLLEPAPSPAPGLTPRSSEPLPGASEQPPRPTAQPTEREAHASRPTTTVVSRPELMPPSQRALAQAQPPEKSPKPSARLSERFNFHNGYFVHEKGATWFEYHVASAGPQLFTSYREYQRDQTHIYLEDNSRSRPESTTPGDYMLVRLPIDGGRFEWTWRAEEGTWRPLHVVQSATR